MLQCSAMRLNLSNTKLHLVYSVPVLNKIFEQIINTFHAVSNKSQIQGVKAWKQICSHIVMLKNV